MPEFVVRARAAPTDPEAFLKAHGEEGHVEYLAQIIINSLFVSQSHRDDVILHLVMEDAKDYSRTVSLDGSSLGSIADQTEKGWLTLLASALKLSVGLGKEQTVECRPGVSVTTISFEHLVKEKLEAGRAVYLLDRKGGDIRSTELDEDGVFLLTDHTPMPKKVAKSLVNKGVIAISLGPKMLHASQCVVLIQNELDRQF